MSDVFDSLKIKALEFIIQELGDPQPSTKESRDSFFTLSRQLDQLGGIMPGTATPWNNSGLWIAAATMLPGVVEKGELQEPYLQLWLELLELAKVRQLHYTWLRQYGDKHGLP